MNPASIPHVNHYNEFPSSQTPSSKISDQQEFSPPVYSATRHALSLPEIVFLILEKIWNRRYECYPAYPLDLVPAASSSESQRPLDNKSALNQLTSKVEPLNPFFINRMGQIQRTLLVNHIFFLESARLLWADPSTVVKRTGINSLHVLLARVSSAEQRQVYANFVRHARLRCLPQLAVRRTRGSGLVRSLVGGEQPSFSNSTTPGLIRNRETKSANDTHFDRDDCGDHDDDDDGMGLDPEPALSNVEPPWQDEAMNGIIFPLLRSVTVVVPTTIEIQDDDVNSNKSPRSIVGISVNAAVSSNSRTRITPFISLPRSPNLSKRVREISQGHIPPLHAPEVLQVAVRRENMITQHINRRNGRRCENLWTAYPVGQSDVPKEWFEVGDVSAMTSLVQDMQVMFPNLEYIYTIDRVFYQLITNQMRKRHKKWQIIRDEMNLK